MSTVDLNIGRTTVSLEYDRAAFEVLTTRESKPALTDHEIGTALDRPIDSPVVEEIVQPGDRVLIVVPDATRQSGCSQIINLIVRRLIANGTAPSDINIIFATGIHRGVTEEEKQTLLTPFIAQRINTFAHDASDIVRNFRVGDIGNGIPVELNWRLTEYDRIILVGSVTFHYFAGFSGGRKLVCPGLASEKTIEATHRLAFDCDTKDRRHGVGTALLDGNPVHEAFQQAVSLVEPSFAISTIVNDAGEITDVYCGDWITSHRRACDDYLASHSLEIGEKRSLVLASCGGYPLDINMIQAHKALESASRVCSDGGTIILLAECADGLGRTDFLDWFESGSSKELAEKLCANYQVNGQTAWSLLRKTERFNVEICTSLAADVVEKMRMRKIWDVRKRLDALATNKAGYILPAASKLYVNVRDTSL